MTTVNPVRVGTFASGEHVHVVIETPSGSRWKYGWKPEAGAYVASKVLPLGMTFPYDFGFFPGTRAADGDPLDALVLADAPLAVAAWSNAASSERSSARQTASVTTA